MTTPIFTAIGARSTTAGATTLTPAKPTVSGLGGKMLAVCQTKNNDTHSTTTGGWNLIAQVNSGANFTASLWEAAETAAAPVFTWTGSVAAAAQVAYYCNANAPVDATIGFAVNSNGLTSTHATASSNSTGGDSLAVYVDAAAANTALATPAGWTEDADAGSATDAGRTTFGSKSLGASGSASGAISVTGANAAWVQFQVELMESAAAGVEASKMELGAVLDLSSGLISSKMELGLILDLEPAGLTVSKVEFGAILDAAPPSGGGRRRQQAFVT